jgi:acyl-CoA hydrolase
MDRVNTYMVMPQHLNPANTLFGGQMMAWMDECTGIFAMEHMGTNRVVTACFKQLDFLKPVRQGELVNICCSVIKEGRSSLEIEVVATARTPGSEEKTRVCQTSAVFVAVDENGKSTPWH